MKNIHVLPTDKPSRFFEILQFNFVFDNQNKYSEEYKKLHKYKNKNIYITSDEDVKDGDCIIDLVRNEISKANGLSNEDVNLILDSGSFANINQCKKIILTTDGDLIKEGVQSIDDEFLQWYIKNPSCEEVEVSEDYFKPSNIVYGYDTEPYKIILPKKETKQETTADYIDRHIVQAMVEVAKQKMYSEEEVINIIYKIYDEMGISISLEDVLKQFKK